MAAKFLPYLLAGISVGGQYALIAIGYTMVYGILRLINFAHGDIFTVAGFLMVYATASLPLTISIPLVVVATVLLGIAVEKIAYKPLRTAPRMSVMISAIGMSYLLQNSMWYVTGGLAKQYPALPWISDTVTVLGCQTKRVTVVTPFLVIVLVAALVTLIQKTKIGMAMRAASRDFETAQLMGIKINNVISFTFAVGSFLAAIGSMMYFSNYTAVTPTVGAMPGLKAFVAAVFGGIGSIPGAVIGGFIIGKLVDSLIIGIICFIGVTILNMPFPMLLSVIIGVTNVIPFFGPFIGAIPAAFLVFLVSPLQCVYFLIWILLLQQFDGNILGPKILGNSTGLSSFWVLFSILFFGGLFGFVGMIIAVPAFAVIYDLISRAVHRSLRLRKLPMETDEYRKLDHIDEKTGTFMELNKK